MSEFRTKQNMFEAEPFTSFEETEFLEFRLEDEDDFNYEDYEFEDDFDEWEDEDDEW